MRRGYLLAVCCCLALLTTLLWGAPLASAASKAILGTFGGTPNGTQGGQLTFSKGVAVNRTGNGAPAGSVYVAEANANHRISQFTKDGAFVRTWGYDVIASGQPNDTGTSFEVCTVATECKAGVAGPGAGQINNPQGIAIDQSNGFLYITNNGNRRVDVFSGSGVFAGAFGYDVLPADPNPSGPDFCTTATGCQAAAAAGIAAGRFGNIAGSMPAVSPGVPGRVFIPDNGNLRVAEYATTITLAGVLTSASFEKAFGWDVVPSNAVTTLESCTLLTTCKEGSFGNGAGQFTTGGSPSAIAVDGSGSMYVTSGPLTAGTCSVATPCRVQKFASDASTASDFGPASGPGQLTFTSGLASDVAALNVAVDPTNEHLYVLRKDSGSTYRIYEYDGANSLVDTHPGPSSPALTALAGTQSTGLGVGLEGRLYVNYGAAGAGRVIILGPVPDPQVKMKPPVTEITSTSARVKGEVTVPSPGGDGFETKYFFEYSADGGVSWSRAPLADGSVGSVAGTYEVTEKLTGLLPNRTYLVRLVGRTGSAVTSQEIFFNTLGAGPSIDLSFTEEVTQTAAELGAHINPNGKATSYHFEWGLTQAYGNRVPVAFDRQLGAGNQALVAKESIAGLQPHTSYHYRVVATNSSGSVQGPDQQFETLNSCGFTDGRCMELVSPSAKGPVGAAGDLVALGQELRFQVAPNADSVAYEMAYGLPEATTGGELLYEAQRESTAWSSKQLSPAAVEVRNSSGVSDPSNAQRLSEDLSCGVYSSTEPLTSDTPATTRAAGKANLFRRGADGSWSVISNLSPSVISATEPLFEYEVIGMNPSCTRIIFRSGFQYPGLTGAGANRLYEWNAGVLKSVGLIPGPSGNEPAETVPGAAESPDDPTPGGEDVPNYWNAASKDASRLFFTAVSKVGGDVGRHAVFLSENGGPGVDISQSETATVNDDSSVYQTASTDGSKVFFVGRYGLAANGKSTGASSCAVDGTGCDLYQYSVADDELTDLSIDTDGAGASVVGVLGASEDGSDVYFAARGQLVSAQGKTEGENSTDNTYSVYLSDSGVVKFAGEIAEQDLENVLVHSSTSLNATWSSRVVEDADGSHLLYQSRAKPTLYDSKGLAEAYVYSSETETVSCISCRRDGKPSQAGPFAAPLVTGFDAWNKMSPPRTMTADGEMVFFISVNALAFGSTPGRDNLYVWDKGQISFIATSPSGSGFELQLAGASPSGNDIYFTTLSQLTWNDTDGLLDLYDARVDGGFAAPPPSLECDPLNEGSCQDLPSGGGGTTSAPASVGLTDPGNEKASSKGEGKKNKKNKKNKKGKKGKKNQRGTNGNRGAAK